MGLTLSLQAQDTIAVPPSPPPPPPPPPEDVWWGRSFFTQPILLHPACDTITQQGELKTCSLEQFVAFIAEHLRYPAEAKSAGISGTVVVSFYIDATGQMEEASIELRRDIGGGCGEEGLRMVQLMCDQNWQWIPAKERGKPIRVLYNVPFKFKL